MTNNFVQFHVHSDLSLIDSATKFEKYIEKAKEYGMKAIGFSEHGNIFSWTNKKEKVEKAGLKYIHAQEFYLTKTLTEKVRDNYHVILISKNLEGAKELNRLSSLACNKQDGHFYYDPRITFDELKATSDNIIITSACLGGVIWKAYEKFNDGEFRSEFVQFLVDNKHRCFLEVQPHNFLDQREYNRLLWHLNKTVGIPLIAGTDTHSIDKPHADARIILQRAKNISYPDEEELDLTFKTYDELVEMFATQNALPKEVYLEAIENTNRLADMIEEFQLDKSHKYPKLYDNPKKVFIDKIWEGVQERKIHQFPLEKRQQYYNRLTEELKVYEICKSEEYMLFQKKIIDWCKDNDIRVGYGRGSVNGSLIAYCMGITEMDSIKWNLNFFRFMNPDRISLADIDIDFPPSRRADVIKYISEMPEIYFAEIITFNTVALKGAIKEVGRALGLPLTDMEKITKDVDGLGKKQYLKNEEKHRKQYPELFKYVDLLQGVNVSVGSHPSGFLTSPVRLDENIGTFYTSESKYPVSQINMKEIDGLNYVKLDCLGLDNIEIINETCKLVGIERLTPDNMDFHDDSVWESIKESPLGIFQFEGQYAHDILSKVLDAVPIIKKKSPLVNRIELMSMTNGAIRPSGASYRDDMCQGIFKDNGHEALNKFLLDTMGYLIYQEQIMNFMTEFCGFTMAQSDTVRRGFAKKIGTEQFLPAIEQGFIRTMKEKYDMSENKAQVILKSFLKVIEDASDYGFSTNHSTPYSCIGYACAYLRKYYPKEFLTVMLNINQDKFEKTSAIVEYANIKNIKILPIQFRKSKEMYSFNDDGIYKGLKSIKYLNAQIAEELFELGKLNHSSFLNLLTLINEITSVNSRQLDILIRLNFFAEFGENQKLLNFVEMFNELYGKKQMKKEKVDKLNLSHDAVKEYCGKETAKTYMEFDSLGFLLRYWDELPEERVSTKEQLRAEYEFLGYLQTNLDVSGNYVYVTDINTKYTPKISTYCLRTGRQQSYKVYKKNYNANYFEIGDIIRIVKVMEKGKPIMVDGEWKESEVEMEQILINYVVLGQEEY